MSSVDANRFKTLALAFMCGPASATACSEEAAQGIVDQDQVDPE
jgi:hypothetical protein